MSSTENMNNIDFVKTEYDEEKLDYDISDNENESITENTEKMELNDDGINTGVDGVIDESGDASVKKNKALEKSHVQIAYEMFPNITFQCKLELIEGKRKYVITTIYKNETFTGVAINKKSAKKICCLNLISALPSNEMISHKERMLRDKAESIELDKQTKSELKKQHNSDLRHTINSKKIQKKTQQKILDLEFLKPEYVKETINYLKEKAVNYNFNYSKSTVDGDTMFDVRLKYSYLGQKGIINARCSTKHVARKMAMYKLRRCIVSPKGFNGDLSKFGISNDSTSHSSFADDIADLVFNKFHELYDVNNDISPIKINNQVIAAIIIEDQGEYFVGSLATGTKCIDGVNLNYTGERVNDCHAEILARRAFKYLIYNHINLCLDENSAKSSMFISNGCNHLRLKPYIKFHLYISSAPCGDSRLFAMQTAQSDVCNSSIDDHSPDDDKHANRNCRGKLRTKVEGGEGTIPVESFYYTDGNLQTLDGILGGQRLRTMSCSDKIAKWMFVGLQGSLLTMLIEPIYLSSVIVSNFYNESHMKRSLFFRFHPNSSSSPAPPCLSPQNNGAGNSQSCDIDLNNGSEGYVYNCNGFKHTQPEVFQARTKMASLQRRLTSRNTSHAGYWVNNDFFRLDDNDTQVHDQMQRIHTTTGLLPNEQCSPLCKKELMTRFAEVLLNCSRKQDGVNWGSDFSAAVDLIKDCEYPTCYRDLKDCARLYNRAKSDMNKAIAKANIGKWLQKPIEVDTFTQDLKHFIN